MKNVVAATAALVLLCLGSLAQANVFDLGTGYTNLETVAVGDPGNIGELSGQGPGGYYPDRICGSVGYTYNIGKYEVTAKQYTDFLNNKAKTDPRGLYNSYMADLSDNYNGKGCNIQRSGVSGNYSYSVAADWANRPVNYVSFWDACRFANWLNNGQGDADTENGAYTLLGYNGTDGRTIARSAGAKWFLPNENEWYKAAYYDPDKQGGPGYWDYPTRSDTPPANQVLPTDPGNSANTVVLEWTPGGRVDHYSVGSPYYRTNVGEFENSASAYGTFDQGGNVWEVNEDVLPYDFGEGMLERGVRGGWFGNSGEMQSRASEATYYMPPAVDVSGTGFRVAYMPEGWQPVPEPSSIIALAGGLAGLLGIRRRRA